MITTTRPSAARAIKTERSEGERQHDVLFGRAQRGSMAMVSQMDDANSTKSVLAPSFKQHFDKQYRISVCSHLWITIHKCIRCDDTSHICGLLHSVEGGSCGGCHHKCILTSLNMFDKCLDAL